MSNLHRTIRRRTPIQDLTLEALESRQLLDGSSALFSNFPPRMSWTNSTVEMTSPSARLDAASGSGVGMSTFDAVSDSLIKYDLFRQDSRFSSLTGQGYAAVILDTGIDRDHPYFGADANGNGISDRIVYSYDFADGDADASDRNGHGSNVSSIVGSSNSTHRGMAPGVNLIHLKVFKDSGAGNFSYTEAALRWVVNNVTNYNIVSVNMSLGDSQNWATNQQLYGISDEIATLAAQNVMVVAAAGNDFAKFNSVKGMAYPAADPNVIAVGAVYDRNFGGGITYASGARADATGADRVTPFSQRSTSMYEIFAPGAPITGANQSGGTVTQHGTSQASPHIAGITVLAQQLADNVLGRRLTLSEMKSLLASTADSIVDGDDEADNVTNTGATFKRVNVKALADAIFEMGGPSARLKLGTVAVAPGTGSVAFGAVAVGASVSKTFTIDNPGTEDLELADLAVPTGYRIISNFASSTLAPGASTTFTVRYDASDPGAANGAISLRRAAI
ncbi:MAG: S8 family serine peptidase [Phycisphaerales bacterium]|nr:S8 family serine peptidase [Phycisphaerales bacterium]